MSRLRLRPIAVYLVMAFFSQLGFLTSATVSIIYQITQANLDPFQLLIVGAVLEATVFLFEVPTGVVADVYSRRLSLLVGFVLIGIGFIILGAFPLFWTILLSQVVWGIGYTFTSGARQAWLSDELGDDDETTRAFVRGARFELAGSLVGIGLSVALASVFVSLSVLVGGAMFIVLAAVLTVVMPENGFQGTPPGERRNWASMTSTLRSGLRAVRGSRILVALIVIELFYGMSSEPFDRLWAKNMLDNFTFPELANLDPIVWFGIVAASALFLGLCVIWWMERVLNVEAPGTPRIVLSLANALLMVASLVFALTRNFGVAMSMVVVISVLRKISEPMVAAWLNRNAESSYRATVFSLHGQTNAFGQVAFGPGMGAVASIYGLRSALIGVALLLIPPQIIYAFTRDDAPDVDSI
ncbi:MAG: MFS transporter [Dehalococcoidia bacterium]|nr:MFS transporter [Dehalococcoidia bacterium]